MRSFLLFFITGFLLAPLQADYLSYFDFEESQYSKVISFGFEDMQRFLKGKKFYNSDDFIEQITLEYPSFLNSFLVIVDSASRQEASTVHPRLVYFSKDNEVVFSISGRPLDTEGEDLKNFLAQGTLNPPHYDTVEIIYEDPIAKDGTLKFQTIDFEKKTGVPLLKENKSCIKCHANNRSSVESTQQSTSYIWANYAYWPGALPEQDPGNGTFSFYETTAIGQFIGSSQNNLARYRHLKKFLGAASVTSSSKQESTSEDLSVFELLLSPKEERIRKWQESARRLAQMSQTFLYAANKQSLKRLAYKIKKQPDYDKAKNIVLAVLMHCDQGNKKHLTEYFSSLSEKANDEVEALEDKLYRAQLAFTDFSNPLGRRSADEIFKRLARLDMAFVPTTARLNWYLNYKWKIDLADYSNHPERATQMFWDGFAGLSHLALAMQSDFPQYNMDGTLFGGLFATLTKGYLPSETGAEEAYRAMRGTESRKVDLSLVGNLDSLYNLSAHELMCQELISAAQVQ